MRTSTHNEVGCVLVRVGERGTVCVLVPIMKLGAHFVRMGERGIVCVLVRIMKLGAY